MAPQTYARSDPFRAAIPFADDAASRIPSPVGPPSTGLVPIDDVLLVEDDEVDVHVVTDLLRRADHGHVQVMVASSVGEAIHLVDEHLPAAILTDLTLPDASRLEAVSRLVHAAPTVPLVVQSGRNDRTTPIEALRLGAQDYLVKDELTPDGLLRSLRYAVTRHRTSSHLDTTEARLGEAHADLEDAAVLLAHDLRGPVRTSLLLSGRLARLIEQPSDEVDQVHGLLEGALSRADRLVATMLEYQDLRTIRVETEPTALAPVVATALEAVTYDAPYVAVAHRSRVDPGLVVTGQHDLLVVVFQHLFSNSIRFRRGDVPLRIDVEAEVVGSQARITVADNGSGIPPHQRDRAMRALERLHSTEPAGIGFGLAICRRTLERLGGQLSILANEPPGCTVAVELPLATRPRSGSSGPPGGLDGLYGRTDTTQRRDLTDWSS